MLGERIDKCKMCILKKNNKLLVNFVKKKIKY